MGSVNYADVVSDLRFRAGELERAAGILEGLMGEEEKPAAPVVSTPAAAPVAAQTRKKTKTKTSPSNLPSLISAVYAAIKEGPRSSSELVNRVLQLRPGTIEREIPKTAYALKLNGKIEKRGESWCVSEPVNTQQQPMARKPDEPTNRDIVRRVLAQGVERTKFEIADHAIAMRPSLKRTDVLTILSQLKAEGECADKDDMFIVAGPNLKVPVAMNGAH